ncbi:cell division control protein 48 homolog C-like [Fagus crenata]
MPILKAGRGGRGGRGGGKMNRDILRRRLQSSKHKSSSNVDEIVDHLRSTYPDYQRIKKQPFTTLVRQSLSTPQTNKKRHVVKPLEEEEDDDEVEASQRSGSQKRKKVEEDRLERIEDSHIRKMRSANPPPIIETTSSESESSNSDSSEEDSSSDGSVSTSDDPVYLDEEEEVKPRKTVEQNIELDVATSSKADKIELVNGNRGSGGGREERVEAPNGGGVGGGVEERRGPRFKDLGGMEAVIEELKMEVIVPLYHPELPRCLGVRPMSGILLHGPPGCGKTKLAHAIANETGVPFYKISATEIISGVSGASEGNIRALFTKAYKTAPSIVFIDEIDAIASKRENLQREMERRIVTQLMTCMDEFQKVQSAGANSNSESSDQPGYVLVIGATNRPDAVDPALRRPGRFDREIVLGVPDESARVKILSVITGNLRLEGSFDLLKIARSTPGFVGADLAALANKAGNLAMKRIIDGRKSELSKVSISEEYTEEWWRQPWLPEEMEKLTITMADFEEAVKMVQPSSKREGFSTIPNVKWEDIGGLDFLRKEFDRYIVRRIKHPEDYEGPELLNKYVGESELAVRTLFSRARTCSPCILFFDEVDALTTTRGKQGGWVVERLLNQLLIELDGAEQRRGVFVIGATNRPEVMDPAVLRPGRFGKLLYVPLPSPDERGLILKALARKKPVDASVDLSFIGQMEACENFSGADLAALMNEAAMLALEDRLTSTETNLDAASFTIKSTHFEQAVGKISPSVLDKQKQYYKILSERLKAA